MFVLPLGLQAKTRDFPWMTVAILLATVVYSALHLDATRRFEARAWNDPTRAERVSRQKALVVAACPRMSEFSARECEVLKSVLKPEIKETIRVFAKRLELETRESGFDKRKRVLVLRRVFKASAFNDAPETVATLKEYGEFQTAVAAEVERRSALAAEEGLLTRSTFSMSTLLRAFFLHDGWEHLIGNMLFFLLFAIPLEQRIGSIALAMIYVAGGASGLTLHLMRTADPSISLVGASANVSAVAAAFMVAFWATQVRVWVSFFFIFNQVTRVPTWLFFALFVVIQDLVGALGVGDGVAYLAHLGGFGVGAALATVAVLLRPLPASFIFHFERELLQSAREEKSAGARLRVIREVLYHNPSNTAAILEGWDVISKQSASAWSDLAPEAREFLSSRFIELVFHFEETDRERLNELLEFGARAGWPWREIVRPTDYGRLMHFLSRLARESRAREALILVDVILQAEISASASHFDFLKRRMETILGSTLNEPSRRFALKARSPRAS